MLQVVNDLNPWAFKTFTPEECPPDILSSIRFGEYLNYVPTKRISTYPYAEVSAKPDNNIAKKIMDRTMLSTKWQLYPEQRFGAIPIDKCESIGLGPEYGAMFHTYMDKGLVQLSDSEEELEFWQHEYPQLLIDAAITSMNVNKYITVEDHSDMPRISIPVAYYNKSENLIYNKVHKLMPDEYGIVPIYISRYGGAIIVRAREECIIPLGSGRIRTKDDAYTLSKNGSSLDHLTGVTTRYYETSCHEYADKAYIVNVLAQLPVDIVSNMSTLKK